MNPKKVKKEVISQLQIVHHQEMAVKLIFLIKKITALSQIQLAEKIGVNRSTLYRYEQHRSLPSLDKAHIIIDLAIKNNLLESLVSKNISIKMEDGTKIVDGTKLLSNTQVLRTIAFLARKQFFYESNVDKIVTSEVDGLGIGYSFAFEFNVPCLYARKERPIAVDDYISVPLRSTSSRQIMLYVPSKALKPREKILIVDDVIRSGKTITALSNLVSKGMGELVGIFSMIGIKDDWKDTKRSNMHAAHFI